MWKMVFLPIVVFLLINVQFVTSQDWLERSKEELINLRNEIHTFDNSISDIVFLVDASGSLSNGNFNQEKAFVRNLLNEISVGMQATRVEVIPFASTASKFITQISAPAVTKNKCTFNDEFDTLDRSINGYMTNMKEAFENAWEVCLNNALKRVPLNQVKTVVILLTDGKWNRPSSDPSPVSLAEDLVAQNVEVFAIGVGNVDFGNLQSLVADPDQHAFHLEDFDQFAELATYIRGGKSVIFCLTTTGLKLRKELIKEISFQVMES